MSAVAKALVNARQKCLSEEEAYWHTQADCINPISPRNEAASLAWLLDHQAAVCRGGPEDVAALQQLCASYCQRLGLPQAPEDEQEDDPDGGNVAADTGSQPDPQQQQQQQAADRRAASAADAASGSERTFDEASTEARLLRACEAKGMAGAARAALFDVAAPAAAAGCTPLRGLMAERDVGAGEVVLQLPTALLLSYDTAKQSDLGRMLVKLPLGLSDDTIALLWTMVERREPESEHAAFWQSLPQRFDTGLSVPDEAIIMLAGTPLQEEAKQARQHLRAAFAGARPVFETLLQAYPTYFRPEWFSWESYIWAAELWYAYAIQVQFPDGAIRTCLPPYLGLMNHHPLPHIVHFSKVDPATSCLRVRTFRPCRGGRQLFLSYGPYPNGKLLLFYGFALRHNPFDELEVVLQQGGSSAGGNVADIEQQGKRQLVLLQSLGLGLQHRLNARGDLALALLAAARVLAAAPERLQALCAAAPAAAKQQLLQPLQLASGAANGAASGGEEDSAALRLLLEQLQRLLPPARECLRNLEPHLGCGAARPGESAEGKEASGVPAAFAHFAAVYAEGVVDALTATCAALDAALAPQTLAP